MSPFTATTPERIGQPSFDAEWKGFVMSASLVIISQIAAYACAWSYMH